LACIQNLNRKNYSRTSPCMGGLASASFLSSKQAVRDREESNSLERPH